MQSANRDGVNGEFIHNAASDTVDQLNTIEKTTHFAAE